MNRVTPWQKGSVIVPPPASKHCEEDLQKLLGIFDRLHIPVAVSKLEGPTECLTYLGIEIDTQAMVLRFPASKLDELRLLVTHWNGS